MTRIVIKKIIYSESNLLHITKHKVKIQEVFKAGENLIYHKKTYQDRYLLVGKSEHRLITIILKRKSRGNYQLVTARDAGKNERKKVYEKERK